MRALALMPFSAEFNDVFASLCAACTKFIELQATTNGEAVPQLDCTRIDKEAGDMDIMKRLLVAIRTATFCIADLTGNNKNVLWELGYAMALTKPVIIITQDRDSIGFDLHNFENLDYCRDELTKTLEVPLVDKIKALLSSPDSFVCPTDPLHAQTLAMSIAAPTYFLGPDFRIRYMNEAAADMFISNGQGAAFWHGRTLREFINDLELRLVNFPAIEKNLQIQTEHIQDLERAGRESDICPYNIEKVVLRTDDYGVIELQKTGVAVKDPIDDAVTGWVVSFNVVRAHNPEKFAAFHQNHATLIEGRLFPVKNSRKATPKKKDNRAPSPEDENTIIRWQSTREPRSEIVLADGYAEKATCFEFSARIMKSDTKRYGLASVRYIPEWFFDYRNSEFLMMRVPGTHMLAGVFRLSLNHSLAQYSNFESPTVEKIAAGKTFADAGAYLRAEIIANNRSWHLATLLGHAAAICSKRSQDFIYAQVPKPTLKFFAAYGWDRVGTDFVCEGWDQQWVPIMLDPDLYRGGELPIDSQYNNEFIQRARDAYHESKSLYEIGP
jgi:hypothetical protein